MRYIAILVALLTVLALAVLGLRAGGLPTGGTPAHHGPTSFSGATAVLEDAPQASYGSAVQAARHAVQQASNDANAAANANP